MAKPRNLDALLQELEAMDLEQLRDAWRRQLRTTPPKVSAGLLRLALAHGAQEKVLGGLRWSRLLGQVGGEVKLIPDVIMPPVWSSDHGGMPPMI